MNIYLATNKKENAFLRKKVPPLDFKKETKKSLRELIKVMRKIMREANGIGLSANQIGVSKRIFVAEIPNEDGKLQFYAFANPEIVKTSGEPALLEEGCLSVPEQYGLVPRAPKLVIEAYNLDGKKIKIKAWGLLAHVFQHEVDHLNGKLFIDKAKQVFKVKKEVSN